MSGSGPIHMGEMYRLLTELQQRVTMLEEGRFVVQRREPSKPREGMLVIADGVAWDPGAGKGAYEYKTGAWVKL